MAWKADWVAVWHKLSLNPNLTMEDCEDAVLWGGLALPAGMTYAAYARCVSFIAS